MIGFNLKKYYQKKETCPLYFRYKILVSSAVSSFQLLLIFTFLGSQQVKALDYIDYVNPFIGTGKYTGPSKWGSYGGTYPGAVAPWGMVQVSPETRNSGQPRGYYYDDDRIYFFSLIHHLSGYPNGSQGFFKIMPFTENEIPGQYELGSRFRDFEENASPGYYRVVLQDLEIEADFTVTARTGLCRFKFNKEKPGGLYINDVQYFNLDNENTITGKTRSMFFVAEFNTKIETIMETEMGLKVDLSNSEENSKISLVKFSFSSVSSEGAINNLKTEIPHWNFEDVRKQAEKLWNDQLGNIYVKGGSESQRIIFYTALYHSFLLPYVASDVDGKYRGFDGRIHQADYYNYYSVFSAWDTFRTLHPLLCLLAPSIQKDMIQSLLDIYDQRGRLPSGPMTGNHTIPIIVDTYFKNIRDFDIGKAYEAMKMSLMQPPFAHEDMQEYIETGYVPAENPESVTRTLEYAYDDWALAKLAAHLGEENDYNLLVKQAFNYRNIYNPSERFMLPRFRDASWATMGGFAEGDKWNYSLFVPHNIGDLTNLMGGDEAFSERLEETFSQGHYIHDNEPPLHYAYLFSFTGKPWKTQKWSREIMTNCYKVEPGGIPGNDDLGALSSWYVFSAMGFYPVCPGNPWYVIGSPVFDKVTFYLENGRQFEINANKVSKENKYIQSAMLNSEIYEKSWLEHSILEAGGILTLNMASEPNLSWASGPQATPPSITLAKPNFVVNDFTFSDTLVHAHQPISLSVAIQNHGATGTFQQMLYINGKIVDTTWVLVRSNEIKQVVQTFRLYDPGDHTVGINNLKMKRLTVLSPSRSPKKSFQMYDLKITPLVKTGEPVDITFKVQNISSYSDRISVPICLNDSSKDNIEIDLRPGEVKTVNSTLTNVKPGMHQVTVESLGPKKVKVYRNPLESMILYLDFDEGQGDISQDYSGFNNDANLMGNAQWVSGKFGRAVKPGEDGYINIPSSPSLEKFEGSLTLMCWIFPIDECSSSFKHSQYVDFFSKGDYYVLKLQDRHTLSFIAGGWGHGQILSAVPNNWNRNWHHVAGVFDGKMLRLYVDGVLHETQKFSGQIENTPFPWNIGRNSEFTENRRLNGYIDEARIYKEPLSVDEIIKAMVQDRYD